MTIKTGTTLSGFTLQRHQSIQEIRADVYLFKHRVLGCPLLAIKNDDHNKTFSAAFNTIPTDSTGVAHILEHSVLMGSEKYPVKDVFGEINKGGLMTFLNAMTGADITYYPFATRNLKEYFNLMDVYCDVVFHPLLLSETFEQEGWHYHQESLEDPVEFQGVVFNEMKGAFSDPIRLIFHHLFGGLMPGSTYAYESGGDPAIIPELSYQAFVDFHRRHYHPSNATFLVYGDAPLEEELAFLQERFLASFPTSQERRTVELGELAREPLTIRDVYGVESSDTAEKTFLAVGTLVGNVSERLENAAFQVISNILYNSDGSPLKNRIISSGICKDFGGLYLSSSCYNTIMVTYLIGSDSNRLETFQKLYRETLEEMVAQGLERELMISELNKFEFSVREEASKAQRGLDLIGKAMTALKYGTDPFQALQTEELLKTVRRLALEESYFEKLIRKRLLENPATVTVCLEPDPGKNRQTATAEQQRLAAYEAGLNREQQERLVARTRHLMELQQTPNQPDRLAVLPRLSLSELPPEIRFHTTEPTSLFGQTVLINNLPTNHLTYLDIGFDFSRLPHRLLPLLDLFGAIVTEIGTEKLSYMDFAKEVNTCTGGLNHAINTYTAVNDPDEVRLIFWISIKTLPEYLDRALDLLADIFSGVSFTETERLKEIVRREFAWAEHAAQSEGYSLPATRVFSHLSTAGRYQEQFTGITAYRAVKELAGDYQQHQEQLVNDLRLMADILFNRHNLTISITATETEIERFTKSGQVVIDALQSRPHDAPPKLPPPDFPRHEAFITAAEIVFAVQGGSLLPGGSGYHGSLEVLKTYLSRDYLWNAVRQSGGAYGCFIQFSHITGNLAFVSYRDPQVRKTFEAYDRVADIVAGLELPRPALEHLIIGTYGAFDPHQSVAGRGATARNEYLSNIDPEMKQRRLEEILATTQADLRDYAEHFRSFNDSCHRAIIGNRARIEKDAELFDSLTEL